MSQPTMQEMLASAKTIDDKLKGVEVKEQAKPAKKTKAKPNAKSAKETK